jgi:signal transduction histidine kinase
VSAPRGTRGARRPHLLVVDDNPLNVEPLCDLLGAMGYDTTPALDGPTALALAAQEPPDLVLLDIMMPGMDGIEVCRRLRAEPATAKIPIVFVTALSDAEDKVRAIDAGGDDFLTKPFNRPILLARIRSLLRLKSVNDELEASYRRLQALERLREDLMQMVVHDLKSPLTSVLAALEMAIDGDLGPLAEPQRELLSDAQHHGGEMLRLIDDLLELTRLEETEIELEVAPLEVDELLRQAAAEWRTRVERRTARLTTPQQTGLSLRGDLRLLRRVLGNLIGNALKHNPPGVHIRVVAEAGAEGVHLSVRDDGVGIAKEHRELIFQKFGRARTGAPLSGSTGIGLSFCRLAVEAHGGRIWVESEQGAGSTFHLLLPYEPRIVVREEVRSDA